MREIKMKVWVDNERMIGPFDLSQNPTYWAHKLEDGERLLYTCLKDKNGVEIYEGDVIDCNGGFGEVIMDTPIGQWSTKQVIGRVNIVEPLWHWYEDSAILGNIYEHPHLLEVSTDE